MPKLPPRALYRLFPLAGKTSAWIGHRFASSGRMLLGLLICAALFGVDFGQTLGYQAAALCFALLATSIILSLRWRPALSVRRVMPELATAEMPFSYFVELTNHGARLERDLVLQDNLNTPPLSYADFQRRRRLASGRRTNWFDRTIGFPRWVEIRRRDRGADVAAVEVPAIAPGSTVRVRLDTVVRRRGWLRFNQLQLLRPDPLGLFRARRSYALSDNVLALPRRYPTPRIRLSSERRYQRGGVSLAHAVGDSQEFASLREYRPGDARKHIHWRSFAKTGRLIVKEYQDEYFDRHALVIDTHISEHEEELFEGLISVAASIAGGEQARDSILDVIFLGQEIVQLSAGRGLGDATHALSYLAEARPSPVSDFQQLASLLRERAAHLASVIVILSTRDDDRQRLLEELAASEIPCLSVLVTTETQAPVRPSISDRHHAYSVRTNALADDLLLIKPPQ